MSSTAAGPSRGPTKPPVVQPGSGNAIIINPCQRLNPLLECIRNVNKEFGDIVPDFQLGRTTCALFLSLKYHRLHPEYIHQRIQKLGQLYTLRLLVLMCDVSEHQELIRELTKICLVNNITIIVCWSNEEAGMYLSTYKAFEHKPPDLIKERVDKEYNAMLRAALTSINKVNKTDVETLRTTFGSFARIARANPEELRRLPGFGQVKVRRIVDAFDKPFRNKATSALPAQTQAEMRLHNETETMEQDEQELLGIDRRRDDESTEKTKDVQPLRSSATQEPSSSTSIPSTQANGPNGSAKRIHSFGSAADMPPPSTSASASTPARQEARESSPVWDIELDLNLPEEDDVVPKRGEKGSKTEAEKNQDEGAVDPRLAKKRTNTYMSVDSGRGNEESRQKSPSPVWDIELE
ncbi:RAD10 [Sanghuangporus weigelae]